jgi:hypothetical protein
MPKLTIDDGLLAALAATGPAAQQIIEQYKALHRPRGRPRASENQYRRLQLWWERFCRLNSGLNEEAAAKKFFRLHGDVVAKEIGLKRAKYNSLRNAVLRGSKETVRVRARRAAEWQIVPTSLGQQILSEQQHRIVVDRNEAILLREAMRREYLGLLPIGPLGKLSTD